MKVKSHLCKTTHPDNESVVLVPELYVAAPLSPLLHIYNLLGLLPLLADLENNTIQLHDSTARGGCS